MKQWLTKRVIQRKENRLLSILLILLLLFFIRCGNIILLYLTNNLEVKPGNNTFYSHLGVASARKVNSRLEILNMEHRPAITAVSTFDLAHSVILTADNPGGSAFFDTGWGMVRIGRGISEIAFSPAGTIRLKDARGRLRYTNTARYLLSPLIQKKSGPSLPPGISKAKGDFLTYTLNLPETSHYLHIPFLLYFYMPLVVIMAAAAIAGSRLRVAFLYYPIMALLFDAQRLLVQIPLGWLFRLVGAELSPGLTLGLAIGLAILFTYIGLKALFTKTGLEDVSWRGRFLLVFMLLPFCLRF